MASKNYLFFSILTSEFNKKLVRQFVLLYVFAGIVITNLQAQTHVFAQLTGSPINTTGWNLIGSAHVGNITGTGNSEMIVCPALNFITGGVFYKEPINLSICTKWIAEFDFRIFDGTQADGLAFCFLDVPPKGLVAGGGMGIPATANGLKICFDPNPNCFPLNFSIYPKLEIRWGVGYDECWPQPTVDNSNGKLSFIRSNNYVHAKIVYINGNISVYLNSVLYITAFQQFNFTGYLGFTAATGAKNDNHSVKNVIIYTSMPPSRAGNDQLICSGQSVQIGTSPAPGLVYTWTPSSGLSNSSIANPVVTLTNTAANKAVYKYFVKTAYDTAVGCSSQDSVVITVAPGNVQSNQTLHVSVCPGTGYKLPSGKMVYASGLYTDTAKNQLGCDSSIKKIDVTVLAVLIKTIDTAIGPGMRYTLPSGIVVDKAGVYSDTIRSRQGCDSIITITRLAILSECLIKISQKDTTVCYGKPLHLSANLTTNSSSCNTYSLSAALQNGLIGWYPFCGNTNDIGPQHNNGYPIGALTYGPDRYNNPAAAIRFTGRGEAVRTNKIDRTAVNTFSYVTWVNTDNTVLLPKETINPYSGYYTDLSSTCVIHATHGYNWNRDNTHTGAGLMVAKNGVFVLEHTDNIVPTPLVWEGNLSGWHSVALVYDKHVPKLYIDGKFVRSGLTTPYTVHPSFGCDSVFLGGRYLYLGSGFGKGFNPSSGTVPSNNFKGSIDDIKIYNRALTDAEVYELYTKDIYKVSWSTGDTSLAIDVAPRQSTRYWVKAASGMVVCSDTVMVNVKPDKTVDTVVANVFSCPGTPYRLPSGKLAGSAGTYMDTLKNSLGCDSLIRTFYVSVSAPAVQITSAADTICAGSSTSFTATGNNAINNPSYQWKVNGRAAGANAPVFTTSSIADGDRVTCTLSGRTACGDSQVLSNAIMIKVRPVPSPSVTIQSSADAVCAGKAISFTATAANTAITPSYQWQVNGVNTGMDQPQFLSNTLSNNDVIVCRITVHDICASGRVVASNELRAHILPLNQAAVDIKVVKDSICTGSSMMFTATAVNGGLSPVFQWQVNGTDRGSNSNTFFSSTLHNADVVDCWLTSSLSCSSPVHAPKPVTVTIYPLPSIAMPPAVAIKGGTAAMLEPVITGSISSYLWTPPDGLSNASIARPVASPLVSTTYQLKVVDKHACTDSASITVKVLTGIKVPNVFSPNGDGINDTWVIEHITDFADCRVMVFNRYGQQVFYAAGYRNTWNGRYNDQPLPLGTYYYIIDLKNGGELIKGSVTIIR